MPSGFRLSFPPSPVSAGEGFLVLRAGRSEETNIYFNETSAPVTALIKVTLTSFVWTFVPANIP